MALRILLADDSMTAQKMGKDILAGAGYEVTAVSNGAAASKKLVDKPDIVILDVYMPGYTGLEICEKIRANMDTAATPVILTVGKMEHWDPKDGQKVKADGVIIKPFEAQDLLATVQKLEKKLAEKPKEEPAYEKTMIFKAPQVEEFKDDSYNEWKSDASSDVSEFEAPPAPAMQMTQEEASAPAFADMFGDSTPAVAPEPAPVAASTPAALDETTEYAQPVVPVAPAEPATEAQKVAAAAVGFDETVRYAHPVIQQVEPAPVMMEAAPAVPEVSLTSQESASFSAMLEPTPVQYEAPVVAAPSHELETTPDTSNVKVKTDPSLATSATDFNEFTTKFAQDPPAEAAPAEAASTENDDDFEARVAAAAAAFEQQAEEAAPVVEAVAEPEPAPAPVEEAPKYERTMIMDASELAAIRKQVAAAQAAKQAETALVPVQAEPEAATVEPISVLTSEPVLETTPEPVIEAAPEPIIETTPEPVLEVTPEPLIERISDAVVETTPEPSATTDPELITSPSMELEVEHNDPQAPPAGMADASLVEQMQAAVEQMPVIEHVEEPEPVIVPEIAPPVAASVTEAPTTGGRDLELANALGAAVGADVPPMEKALAAAAASSGAAAGLEATAVAQVVHKVLERMLPNIVSEVTREIDQLKK